MEACKDMSEDGWAREDRYDDHGDEDGGTGFGDVRSALLRNPVRHRIVDQLARTPGLNKNQLRRELDVLPNLLDFHLERLAEHGLVVTRPGARDNEVLCFLETDEDLWDDEELRIMFGRESTRDIGLFIARNPGADTEAIAEAVGLSEVTVRHHLRTLRDHDMVQRTRLGRSFEYHPSELLDSWNELVGDAFAHRLDGPDAEAPEPRDR